MSVHKHGKGYRGVLTLTTRTYSTAEQASKALDELRTRLAQLRPSEPSLSIPPHMIPSITYPRRWG
jgi:hypothetical protein